MKLLRTTELLRISAIAIVTTVVLAATGSESIDAPALTKTEPLQQSSQSNSPSVPLVGPDLSLNTVAWFAVVVILALTLGTRPLLSRRSVDGLVLAFMCLFVLLRSARAPAGPLGYSWPWWSVVLLSAAMGYWLIRGTFLLFGQPASRSESNATLAAMMVFASAASIIAGAYAWHSPLTDASRDALIGGLYTAETGKLPYGDVPGHDGRSPLLYYAQAGVLRLVPARLPKSPGLPPTLSWSTREAWRGAGWETRADLAPIRTLNLGLLGITLFGVFLIGWNLHSATMGFAAVAIAAVFPGTLECIPHPNAMIAAATMSLTIAFSLLPGIGGLLGTLASIAAGIAWPWAWFALPAVLVYFLRRGWHAVGAMLGFVAGIAGIAAGLLYLAEPAIPRADGAIAAAGMQPAYRAELDSERILRIEKREVSAAHAGHVLGSIWDWLLAGENLQVRTGADAGVSGLSPRAGVDPQTVYYWNIDADDALRTALQPDYRRAAREHVPEFARATMSARTILEAIWTPRAPRTPIARGSWEIWGAFEPQNQAQYLVIRRIVKITAAVIALAAAALMFLRPRVDVPQLVGAFSLISPCALLAGIDGAATNLVWVMPAILATISVSTQAALPVTAAPPTAPRITVQR